METPALFILGGASDTIQVHTLDISPDPITIPGEEKVGFDITVTTNITKPTRLEMVVKKKLFGVFIKVPCINNVGSW